MPWQRDLADVLYEYDPVTGLFRYGNDDTTVPRQSGKTTVTLARQVHRMTVMSRRHGPQRATYTAQTRLAARKKLERDFVVALRSSRSFRELVSIRGRPTKATEWKLSTNNGSENIQFGLGNYLQIDAPTETAGHGDTLDMGTIDEAFAHEDDAVEGAMKPAMATRKNAQLSTLSTAGTAKSKFFYRRVVAGRNACESGHHGSTCYTEFSAPEDADPGDPATWWACMPALGHTVTEQFIRDEWDRAQRKGQPGVDTFRRAYLNQWVDPPVLDSDGPRDAGFDTAATWADLADPNAPRGTGPVFAVAAAPDRSWAAVAVAWRREDGHLQVMLTDYERETAWVGGRVAALRAKWAGRVLIDPTAAGVIDAHKAETETTAGVAQNKLADRIANRTVRHGNQPAMNVAVSAARWVPRGTTRVLERKGRTDISPLVAAALAAHGVTEAPAADFYTL
jgi:hypothetical protein